MRFKVSKVEVRCPFEDWEPGWKNWDEDAISWLPSIGIDPAGWYGGGDMAGLLICIPADFFVEYIPVSEHEHGYIIFTQTMENGEEKVLAKAEIYLVKRTYQRQFPGEKKPDILRIICWPGKYTLHLIGISCQECKGCKKGGKQ